MHPIFNKALKRFGETKNYLECGFIIPDGKMLQLKKVGGTHGDQIKAIEDSTLRQFLELGGIRVINTIKICNVEMHMEPTTQQYSTLESVMDHYTHNDSYFSCDLIDSNRTFSKVIDLEVYDPSKVISMIKSFFAGNQPHVRENLEPVYNFVTEKSDKPGYTKQKIYTAAKSIWDWFRSTKVRLGSLPSSPNVADTTKAGYDRLLNDVMDDYVHWEKQRKELTWAEQLRETRRNPRVNDYKSVIFKPGAKLKLETIFKFKHNDWLVFVANRYKITNGGIIITMVVIEPATSTFAMLKQLNYNFSESDINLSDIVKKNNIPKEVQTLIERNSKYYVYANKAAEKWMIDRQGAGFRQYVTHLTLQSYGKLNRAYDVSNLSPIQIFGKLKKHLGITKDYLSAGYILPDGRMLQRYEFKNDEVIQDIFNASIKPDEVNTTLMQLGIVRINCQFTYGIYMTKKPTYVQMQVLAGILEHYNASQGLINLKRDAEEHVKHFDITKPDEVIAEIETFYKQSDSDASVESHLIKLGKIIT